MLSVKGSLALTALVFAAMLTGGGLLAGMGLAGVALSEWLFVAGPAVVWGAASGRPVATLRLTYPGGRALAGAALAGATLWIVIAYGLLPLQEMLSPTPPALEEALKRLVVAGGVPWIPWLVLAVTPAVCEELLFRGLLLPSLVRRAGPAVGVVATAALFALLHLDPHRFLATFLLGVAFGLMAVWTGSTLPSMVAHGVSNGFIILLAQPGNESLDEGLQAHRLVAIGAAVVLLTIGLNLVRSQTRSAPNVS